MSSKYSKPPKSELHNLLMYYQNKQYDKAENSALSIVQKYPMHNYAWKILAAVLEQMQRVPEAIIANQKALKIEPNDPEVHLSLGNNLGHLEKLKDAELSYKKAIEIKPDYFQAYYNLANILKKMQRFEEAASNFKRVIAIKPDFAQGYNSFGTTLIDLGQLNDALVILKKAIEIKPDYSQAFFNLSIVHRALDKKKEALENLKQAIALNPKYIRAYNVLGVTLVELGRHEEALKNFQKASLLDPGYVEAYNNLGNALKELGRFEDASENFKKAIDLKPDYAEGLNNFGRLLMLTNNFEKAFQLMEWRLKLEELNFIPLESSKPRWEGNKDQKVFLLKEQGIGDYIMFSSMIPELESKTDKLIIECDKRLLTIFQRSFSKKIKFTFDRMEVSHNDFDCHIPIGSLPLHFRKELNDFQISSKGWIKADTERVQNIRKSILQIKSKKIIGVSWKTKSLLIHSRLRNIELAKLLETLKDLDLIFVNLQYGDVSEEINNLRLDHGIEVLQMTDIDLYNDLDGLAALISACDCVITIDNLTIHFAGALGVNTKLLLPKIADERWGLESSKSYLYDSVTLYRQSSYNNWSEPLKKMKADIENLYSKN